MKWTLFFLACLKIVPVSATVRSVSNYPSTLAQFNTIQGAIDASSNGDSIYVHGSPNDYAGFSLINKKLVILGPGFAPNVQVTFVARVAIGSSTINGAQAKKSEIQGLVFISDINITSPVPDSLRFIRNNIAGTLSIGTSAATIRGFTFQGNFFSNRVNGLPTATFENFLFENNIFRSNDYAILDFFNAVNVLFNHNLWFANASTDQNIIYNTRQVLFTNNIFINRQFNANAPLTQCTFINNLTFSCDINTPWTFNGNIDGGGNVANMDPQMVDQAAVNNGTASYLSNFTISTGPANNSGSDGKDLGLLFDTTGSLNWTNSRNSRMPSMVSMNITNPVIGAGGTLNVTLEARKND